MKTTSGRYFSEISRISYRESSSQIFWWGRQVKQFLDRESDWSYFLISVSDEYSSYNNIILIKLQIKYDKYVKE